MSLRQQSTEAVLGAVADLTKKVIPGNPEASVSMEGGRPTFTAAATGELARDLDEVQCTRDEGPCLHAARTGELTEVRDTRTDPRWAAYMKRAVERGTLSSLSVPLVVDGDVCGSLNIYARQGAAFEDDAVSVATGFAPYAAVALRNMSDLQASEDTARDLEAALASGTVVDEAAGILMERYELTAEQAIQVLHQLSVHGDV